MFSVHHIYFDNLLLVRKDAEQITEEIRRKRKILNLIKLLCFPMYFSDKDSFK